MSRHRDNEISKRRMEKKEKLRKKRENIHQITKKVFPKYFSLLSNHDEVLNFINSLLKIDFKSRKLILDMTKISDIDISALIYTKVILKIIRNISKKIRFEGYYPFDEKIKEYLTSSGFLDSKDNKNLEIKEGHIIEKNIAVDIVKYLKSYKNIPEVSLKALYSILLELMDNTEQHAYENVGKYNKWYLYFEIKNDKVIFIFFDIGIGIVNRVRELYQKFEPKKYNIVRRMADSLLLAITLQGGYNLSSTGNKNRNKGLPNLYEKFENKNIENLKIISHNACFNFNKNLDLKHPLNGTLFYWELIRK